MLTPRENLIKAIRRDHPEYIPFGIELCPSKVKHLKETTGLDPFDYFKLPYRPVWLNPTKRTNQYDAYYAGVKADSIDEWGVGHINAGAEHFSGMVHIMQDFASVDEIMSFPLPDLDADYRWDGVAQRAAHIKEQGYAAVFFAVQVFEPAWYLRGMEQLLMDMCTQSELAVACLDRLTVLQAKLCRRLAECGIDMIVYGDDVGSQQSLILSARMWRKFLKPTMQTVIAAAKAVNPALIAYYHSDGYIEPLIDELIEIGVDVLNPVQPECMDPVDIKQKFGDRLSFWGTIGTQTTMPFWKPEDVRREALKMIEHVGKNGGLVLAPTHMIEPEVPWENIEELYKTVTQYGKY